ncbi:TonB-dependent siderophore receptor [uncultured Massilia sp.]|uniref:TonB-dependent siderophore receptor n=1 Tax=uncultured Massilia sp. TaxID=169973 RepID=UPI0025D7BE19|nr:TonB-dependent siderophore receptor [uncultured Massilia sp.]
MMFRPHAEATPSQFLPFPLRRTAQAAMLCAMLCAALVAPHAARAGEAAPGPDDADAIPVHTVTITGTHQAEQGFAARKASVFKGIDDIRDVPQPVTVLTRAFLDDRVLPDLQDVLRNTPGVTVDYTDSERVTYFSRGYQIDALQVDGMTINQAGSMFAQPDTAVLDHVEILRGASGMLRGAGNPSAAVNLVRKRPTGTLQAQAAATLGSWDRRRIEADVSGPLNASGSLRGRVVAVKDKRDFFQDVRKEDREVLYAVLEADLAPATLLTASLQHTDLDATGAWGNLPSALDGGPLHLPRSTYLGAAWNRWNRYNDQAMLALEHGFANGWKLKASAAYTGLKMKPWGFLQSYFTRPAGATNPYLFNVSTSAYTGDTSNQRVLSFTADGPFQAFGRRHTLVVGAERQDVDTIGTSGYFNLGPMTNVDIRTWNPYAVARPAIAPGTAYAANGNKTSQEGVYATTRLSLTDPLAVLLGTRLSWWDYDVPAAPSGNYRIARQTTPYAGITYAVNRNVSAYASYTEIFTPQNFKDRSGAILAPVTGKDVEAGLKGEFYGGRVTATLGLFRIDNEGKAAQDTAAGTPCLPWYPTGYCYIDGGRQRSEGWELEVNGEVLPGLQLTGGYTHTRTSYLADSTASNVGQPLRSIDPKHLLRVFATWRPTGGALDGWTVGGGVQAQSETYVRSGAVSATQGSYAVWNAMVGYRFGPTWALQANVNNVFDKVYYAKYAPTGIGNYYGDPRNVLVTLRANF